MTSHTTTIPHRWYLILLLLLIALPPCSSQAEANLKSSEISRNNRSWFSPLSLSRKTTAYQPNLPPPDPATARATNSVMRAWHCHGRSQRELVDRLRQAKIVQSPAVQQVLEQVDRQHYILNNPYQDAPQSIAKSQTISAPHMHAHVLEEILPVTNRVAARQQDRSTQEDKKEEQQEQPRPVKILDVGCGSGYLTACFGRWFKSCDPKEAPILPVPGKVFGMDIHPELVELSRSNMRKADSDLLLLGNNDNDGVIQLRVGNGWEGWPEEAPFDAIHVGAAAASFPMTLAQQLNVHGVLIVPVGPLHGIQTLLKVERLDSHTGNFAKDYRLTELLGVRYVPLVQGPNE